MRSRRREDLTNKEHIQHFLNHLYDAPPPKADRSGCASNVCCTEDYSRFGCPTLVSLVAQLLANDSSTVILMLQSHCVVEYSSL